MAEQLSLLSDSHSSVLQTSQSTPRLDDTVTLFPADFFDEESIPERIGRTAVAKSVKSQVLSPASGFMDDYDFILNPYMGCQFGCAYCYAAFFVNSAERREDWGGWVDVKTNALNELGKKRTLLGKKIYMSSVTDPYQPIEGKIHLARSILELLATKDKQPRLVIQTRSPLSARDIDLMQRFDHLRVNMTVTTDSDTIRKHFEPSCPSNDLRIEALARIKAAGIRVCVYYADAAA